MTATTLPLDGASTGRLRTSPVPRRRSTLAGTWLAAAVTIVTAACMSVAGMHSASAGQQLPSRHPVTAEGEAPPPAALAPLRRLADDLHTAGAAEAARAGYSGLSLDPASGAVTLFAVGAGAGSAILHRARAADPRADWSSVHVAMATFSRARLDATIAALIATSGRGAGLLAVSGATDGSGIVAEVPATSRLTGRVTSFRGVPVRYVEGRARDARSWADIKWHDYKPFIGGDVLTTGNSYCTAGLPAVRRSDGHPIMIAAAHCFGLGQRVYTAGGKTGAFHNGVLGNYVGTVTHRNYKWDAATLDGEPNNADESDTYGWKRLTSTAYSYVGDYVCQNGAASFFLGHPTPCGIKVTNEDLWFPIGGHWARGVEGIDVLHGWGSHNGDSGATVFAVLPNGNRQARGMVSSGGADGTPDQRRVDWVEAPDIFAAYGLKLNPVT